MAQLEANEVGVVQIRATVDINVKRRFFAMLQLEGLTFSAWLRLQIEDWMARNNVKTVD